MCKIIKILASVNIKIYYRIKFYIIFWIHTYLICKISTYRLFYMIFAWLIKLAGKKRWKNVPFGHAVHERTFQPRRAWKVPFGHGVTKRSQSPVCYGQQPSGAPHFGHTVADGGIFFKNMRNAYYFLKKFKKIFLRKVRWEATRHRQITDF